MKFLKCVFTVLLYLFATGCGGTDGSDGTAPTKLPPSKPAMVPCPSTQAELAAPCVTPGQQCQFQAAVKYPAPAVVTVVCVCGDDGTQDCFQS